VQIAERPGLERLRARAFVNAGVSSKILGDYDAAHELATAAIPLFDGLGDEAGKARAILNVGIVHDDRGELDEALRRFREAASVFEKLSDAGALFSARGSIAGILVRQGEHGQALQAYRQALETTDGFRSSHSVALVRSDYALLLSQHGEHASALATIRSAIDDLETIGHDAGLAHALNRYGQILISSSPSDALAAHRRALELADQVGVANEVAVAHDGIAQCLVSLGDPAGAVPALERAQAGYTSLGMPEAEQVSARLAALTGRP